MKVSTEKIPDSQVLMTIEVEQERLDQARKDAVKKLSPKAKVPGFRPGKAPPDMVRRYFGEEAILDEALDALVPQVYVEAIQANEGIEPIARPRLEVATTDPLVVKATIPVRPTVELPDYSDVRVSVEPVAVEESRIDDTIEALRRRAATLEPMERELGWGDVVRMEIEAYVEVEGAAPTLVDPSGKPLVASKQREPIVNRQEAEVQLNQDADVLFPGFEEQLVGKKKGDRLELELEVPEGVGDDRFKGKQAHFSVSILETKQEVLPEVDDDFLKAIGDGYATLEALRERIRADIVRAEERAREDRWHGEILAALVERATIEYPPVLVEAEIDNLLHDQFGHVQHEPNFSEYLQSLGISVAEMREQARPAAEARLRNGLVLGKVTEMEGIDVTDEEVGAEIERMVASSGPQGEQMRQLFATDEARRTLRRNLLTRKTLNRLVEIATEGAYPKPEEAPAAPPADAAVEGASDAITADAQSEEPTPTE